MELRGGGDKTGFRTASEVKNDKMTLVTIQIKERRRKASPVSQSGRLMGWIDVNYKCKLEK